MASPSTVFLGVPAQQTATFNVAAGVFQYVESILVEIDNTAGPDVRPTLKVASPSGVVMATKRQGEVIPAGDTGTATWALRLTDETPAAPSGAGTVFVEGFQQDQFNGTVISALNFTLLPWVKAGGNDLFDLTDPHNPVTLADGWYTFTGTVFFQAHIAGTPPNGTVLKASLNVFLGVLAPIGQQAQITWNDALPGANGCNIAHTNFLPAGAICQFSAGNGWDPGGQDLEAFYGLSVAFEPFSLAP